VIGDSQHANLLLETFIKSYKELFLSTTIKRPIKEDSPQIREFQMTIKKGTLRLAKSFLEREKKAGAQSADEDDEEKIIETLSEEVKKPAGKERTALEGVFQQEKTNQTTWKPPIDRSTKYKPTAQMGDSKQRSTSIGEEVEEGNQIIGKARSLSVGDRTNVAIGRRNSTSNKESAPDVHLIVKEVIQTETAKVEEAVLQEKEVVQEENLKVEEKKEEIKEETTKEEIKEETPSASATKIEPLSIPYLVSQLMEGNNLVVESYLNTLDVEQRSVVVDEMNLELMKQVV